VAFWLKPLLELTAAGTVAEFHDIPFYPSPDHCAAKVRRINDAQRAFAGENFWIPINIRESGDWNADVKRNRVQLQVPLS
jgi:hypothetical protein